MVEGDHPAPAHLSEEAGVDPVLGPTAALEPVAAGENRGVGGEELDPQVEKAQLSPALRVFAAEDRGARLAAATAGDDYALLFAAQPDFAPPVAATRVGRFGEGSGLTLLDADGAVPLPPSLGFLHGG